MFPGSNISASEKRLLALVEDRQTDGEEIQKLLELVRDRLIEDRATFAGGEVAGEERLLELVRDRHAFATGHSAVFHHGKNVTAEYLRELDLDIFVLENVLKAQTRLINQALPRQLEARALIAK